MVIRKAVRQSVPKAALPSFTPVPRKNPRHDGWTPERQKAFIEALADTGCVSIACRMVNMSQPSYYYLRRQPGAESFRAAADAAQTLGLQRVKDEAFERAMTGELIPVFVAGKLMGFRRKKNDRLLMFVLRHYGQDAAGRRTTINYFSTKATAGAAAQNPPLPGGEGRGEGSGASASVSAAEASTTTVKTIVTGGGAPSQLAADGAAADLINAFEGVELDEAAQAEIYRTLEACAERRRALEAEPEHDPERCYIGEAETNGYLGQLESGFEDDWVEYKPEGEHSWENLGEGGNAAEIDRVVGEMRERLAKETPEDRATRQAAEEAMARAQWAKANKPGPGYLGSRPPALPAPEPDPDDPKLDWRNWTGGAYQPPSPLRGRGIEGEGESQPEPIPSPTAEGAPDPDPGLSVPSPGKPAKARKRSPEQGRRTYKPRKRKPRFTPPDGADYERRKAKAVKQVEAERSEAAAAEAKRRERRRAHKPVLSLSKGPRP